jgi:polyvinyl alcohol dehydrogenase (cytochrome)
MHRFFGLLSLALTCTAVAAPADVPPDGKALFEKNCALCHKPDANNRTPTLAALKWLPHAAILTALESGSMKTQGAALSAAERQAIADFLAPTTEASVEPAKTNFCAAGAAPLSNLNGWNGWSTDLVNSRMQPTEAAGIRAADVPKLKVKWAFGFANAATVFAQPTVVGGRLFFGSGNGTIYSLDARTGCLYWTFRASSAVRSAISVAPLGNGQYAAYFGDGQANVYAVNAQTGDLLWKTRIEDHKLAGITGAPKVYDGRVYVGVRTEG